MIPPDTAIELETKERDNTHVFDRFTPHIIRGKVELYDSTLWLKGHDVTSKDFKPLTMNLVVKGTRLSWNTKLSLLMYS